MRKFIAIIFYLLLSTSLFAQDTTDVKEVATGLRADGKIYVVIAVALTVLLGLIIYLISLDRKISRIEKHNL
jgi:K+-transporting ATPase A subunit